MGTSEAIDLHDYELRELAERVAPVLDAVRRRGDEALVGTPFELGTTAARRLGTTSTHRLSTTTTHRLSTTTTLRLSTTDTQRCLRALPGGVIDDLQLAQEQMRRFAEVQRAAICDFETEPLPGLRCGVRHVPVDSAGVCLPAEPAGLTLQAAQAAVIAARAAGVRRVVACVPDAGNSARAAARAGLGVAGAGPRTSAEDRPSALLVGALALAGAHEIYLTAGVRALAALTLGTESIPRTDAVIVADACDEAMAEAARQLAVIGTGRLRPGILIVADEDADPELVAADLISAHGCGPDARAVLITTSPVVAARVAGAVERQLDLLPAGDGAARTWHERGAISLVAGPEAACRLANRHGIECIELMTSDPRWYLNRLRRCRQVFMGASAGASLADQLLAPTTPPAASSEAASVASFLRTITFREGHAGEQAAVARLHRLVGLEAHARACEARAGRRLPTLAALAKS